MIKRLIFLLLFIVGLSIPARAACSHTQIGTSAFFCEQLSTGQAAAASSTATATNHANHAILVAFILVNSAGAPTITISNSAGGGYTWTAQGAVCQDNASGGNQFNAVFIAVVPSAFTGTDTYTFGAVGAAYTIGTILEYTGENFSAPTSGSPAACNAQAASTTPTSSAFSTTTGNMGVGTISCFAGGNAAGSGWTSRGVDALPRTMIEDQIVAGGTTTATGTCTLGANSGYVFSINPAATSVVRRRASVVNR